MSELISIGQTMSALLKIQGAELESLRAKLADAEKDAERLNWLEKNCAGASDSERYLPFRVYWRTKGIRKTIDAAIEADKKLRTVGISKPAETESVTQTNSLGRAVLYDVEAERKRQDQKWGGSAHDDCHSTADFVQLIEDYAGWARVMAGMSNYEKTRNRLVQVAALAVAAVESMDRRMHILFGNTEKGGE